MSDAVLAARIAAFAALIGVSITFLTALLGHWYNRNAKVQDWQLSKRISNIDEIVSKMNTISANLDAMLLAAFDVYQSAEKLTRMIHSALMFPNEENPDLEQESINLEGVKYADIRTKAIDLTTAMNYECIEWRKHKSLQLLLWLEDRKKYEERLTVLARDQEAFALKIYVLLNRSLPASIHEIKAVSHAIEFQEAELERLAEIYQQINDEKDSLLDESIAIQKILSDSMTRTTTTFWRFLLDTFLGPRVFKLLSRFKRWAIMISHRVV